VNRYLRMLGGAALALAVGLIAIRIAVPGWLTAFAGVVTGAKTHNETGGGYFLALLHGDVATWAHAFPLSLPGFYIGLAQLGAVQAAVLVAVLLDSPAPDSPRRLWRLSPLLALSPLCLITSPYQGNYPPITAALLLTAFATTASCSGHAARRASAIAALCAFAVFVALDVPSEARNIAVRTGTAPSSIRALAFIAEHRRDLAADGVLIAVSPSSYMLWRESGVHPLISTYSGFERCGDRNRVQFVALGYPGSGELLVAQRPPWLTDDEYSLNYRPPLPQPAIVLGRRISRSSQTWESAIYVHHHQVCPGTEPTD